MKAIKVAWVNDDDDDGDDDDSEIEMRTHILVKENRN